MNEAQETATQNLHRNAKESSRIPSAMILLAIVVPGTAVATHALAPERDSSGIGSGSEFQNRIGGFSGPTYYRNASLPLPVFNQSSPYTVPQSPEKPVSPGSPGSVFGDH
jgi:hypothetical protein